LLKTFKLLSKQVQLRKRGIRATATIINFDKKENSEGMEYFPVLKFVTNTGNVVEKRIEEARSIKPKIGKEIIIVYDALNPLEIIIENKWFLYLKVFSILAELYIIVYFSYFIITNKWLF
jgi:hypothetical protein